MHSVIRYIVISGSRYKEVYVLSLWHHHIIIIIIITITIITDCHHY